MPPSSTGAFSSQSPRRGGGGNGEAAGRRRAQKSSCADRSNIIPQCFVRGGWASGESRARA
eukprot:8004412-Pyramimonas_sp.AAC.1